MYDNIDNPEDVDIIVFELDKVPMQDFVSSLRKSVVHAVKDAQVCMQIRFDGPKLKGDKLELYPVGFVQQD